MKNTEEITPLILSLNHSKGIKILIDAGANIFARTKKDDTILIMACSLGHKDIVDEIIPHITGKVSGEVPSLENSYRKNVNLKNKDGITALMAACKYNSANHNTIVETLLKRFADPNVCDFKQRSTPLHLVVGHGNRHLVNCLLHNGANVNAVDKDGVTPIFLAAELGFSNIVSNLLAKRCER